MRLPGFTAESTLYDHDDDFAIHVSEDGAVRFAAMPEIRIAVGTDTTGPGGDDVGLPVVGGPFSSGVKGPLPSKFFPVPGIKERKCTPCIGGWQRCPNGLGNMIKVQCDD